MNNDHNHKPGFNENKRRIVMEKLKKLCIENSASPKNIVYEIVFREGI